MDEWRNAVIEECAEVCLDYAASMSLTADLKGRYPDFVQAQRHQNMLVAEKLAGDIRKLKSVSKLRD